MTDKPSKYPGEVLPPGCWWDDMPDPLHTKEDVEELFRMVEEKKAKRAKDQEPQ